MFWTVRRLTPSIKKIWEETIAKSETPTKVPSYDTIDKFLEVERLALVQLDNAKQLDSREHDFTNSNRDTQSSHRTKEVKSVHVAQNADSKGKNLCPLCQAEHFLLNCEAFKSKSPIERKKVITSESLGYNCLGKYTVSNCKTSKRCQMANCGGKHHTMIHFTNNSASQNAAVGLSSEDGNSSEMIVFLDTRVALSRADRGLETVYLATA